MNLLSVPTPRVFIDIDRVRRNIARMAEVAATAGVRLRPHIKTHKSPVIARWQIAAGAVGICCAKLGEAEVFADGGIDDIGFQHHTGTAAVGAVIDLLVGAYAEVAQIDEGQLPNAARQRITDQRDSQRTGIHLRHEGDDAGAPEW